MKTYDALLIDARTGNLQSVYNTLQMMGYSILISTDPADLKEAGRVILPGVGAFSKFMQGLQQRGFVDALKSKAQQGDPLLGICVGMQAMLSLSEEMGRHTGLDLLPGRVVRFLDFLDLKVPHTGWNQLWFNRRSPFSQGLQSGCYAYFNHSYYCQPDHPMDVIAQTDYGIDFASIIQHDNLFGVQFHPEKSQHIGQKILSNFFKI